VTDSADSVGILETGEGLRLEYPPEPVELRAHLRESALEPGAGTLRTGERTSYESSFSAWLWEIWRPALEPVGVDRESFVEIVCGYRRELWFWILGDRGWDQLLSGLAGRVSRRVPSQ
jgi:hypothetical protein